jgi:zinc transporter 1/2/3
MLFHTNQFLYSSLVFFFFLCAISYSSPLGTFDGVCAGILIYIGYTLLLKDFPEDMERYCKGHKYEQYMRGAMFIALWIGAGLMAFIGKYL